MALTALQTDFKLRRISSHSRISQQVFFNYNILFSCQRAKHLWINQSRRHSLSCERYWQTQRTRSLRWLNSSQTTWPFLHPEWNFVCCGWICNMWVLRVSLEKSTPWAWDKFPDPLHHRWIQHQLGTSLHCTLKTRYTSYWFMRIVFWCFHQTQRKR